MATISKELEKKIIELIKSSKKNEAIKLVRKELNKDFKTAKEIVELYITSNNI